MSYLPFKFAVFIATLVLGILAATLFLAGPQKPVVEKKTLDSTLSNVTAKPKKIVCSLGENKNDGKSCKCEEVDE